MLPGLLLHNAGFSSALHDQPPSVARLPVVKRVAEEPKAWYNVKVLLAQISSTSGGQQCDTGSLPLFPRIFDQEGASCSTAAGDNIGLVTKTDWPRYRAKTLGGDLVGGAKA